METKRSKRVSSLFRRGLGLPRNPFHRDAIFRQHEAHVNAAATSTSDPHNHPLDSSNTATKRQLAAQEQQQQQCIEETTIFLRSLNSARRTEGASPLICLPPLSSCVQTYASHLPNAEPFKPGRMSLHTIPPTQLNPTSRGGVRLIGPPGHGALTCAEQWCGGKYRRHGFGTPEEVAKGEGHAENCPCHLHPVWSVIVDERWVGVGFGKTGDGRWVVELCPREHTAPFGGEGEGGVMQRYGETGMECERIYNGEEVVGDGLPSKHSSLQLAAEHAALCSSTSKSLPESPILVDGSEDGGVGAQGAS